MNCQENWILVICCGLLSFCLIFIMTLIISILRTIKKISRIFSGFLNFFSIKNTLFSPLIILKKIFCSFCNKYQEFDKQSCDDDEDDDEDVNEMCEEEILRKRKLLKIIKLTVIAISVLGFLKNKK